jgi:thioredoxin 1
MAKKIKLDIRAAARFDDEGGVYRATIGELGLDSVGGSEDEAFANLIDLIRARLDDEGFQGLWNNFVAKHGEEVEEDSNERQSLIDRSREASKSFRMLTDDTLDDAIASSTPVLVDFWAEWCMPCHMMAPVLKEVADELGERLVVAKLNVDDHKDAWERFEIRGIPTLILFKNGGELHRIVGAGRTKESMLAELSPHL